MYDAFDRMNSEMVTNILLHGKSSHINFSLKHARGDGQGPRGGWWDSGKHGMKLISNFIFRVNTRKLKTYKNRRSLCPRGATCLPLSLDAPGDGIRGGGYGGCWVREIKGVAIQMFFMSMDSVGS